MSRPSTEETELKSPPRRSTTLLQCNHSSALASLLAPYAQVYQQESTGHRSHISLWSSRNASVSKWQRDGWWMDPVAFIWQFCPSAERKMRPHVPVQSLQEEMKSGFHEIASKLPLQSRILIFRYYTLECFI